ncbi:PREDICTED: glutamate receptor 1-like [Priapulus caudatus]|uniref:Glutamate receptor 1-like n=1 Tax=Priapulus caudatus TaxID=37621 RepID=A0ABM1E897_PRICU|nr:PREDICTED: glutamate receptor 1-like [Priapulus caudatus]
MSPRRLAAAATAAADGRMLTALCAALCWRVLLQPVRAQVDATALVRIPVGLILSPDSRQMNASFRYGLRNLAPSSSWQTHWRLDAVTEFTDTGNSFDIERAICRELETGIFVLIGATQTSSFPTMQSYTDSFQLPMLTPGSPAHHSVEEQDHYQVYMRPDYSTALYDIIRYYGWDYVYYLYTCDEGLLNLERLFILMGPRSNTLNVAARFLSPDNSTASQLLKYLNDADDKMALRRIIIDSRSLESTQRVMDLLADANMTTKYYHYVIASFASEELNLQKFGHEGANVTGLRILERSGRALRDFYNKGDWEGARQESSGRGGASQHKLMYEAALIYDSLRVIHAAFSRLLEASPTALKRHLRRGEVYNNGSRGIGNCDADRVVPFEAGNRILSTIKQVSLENGLSGNIAFDEHGRRVNYTIYIWEYTLNREKTKQQFKFKCVCG